MWLDEDGNGTKGNGELYRIISYEEDGSIKVIRDSFLSKEWDSKGNRTPNNNNGFCTSGETNGCNSWGNTSNTYSNDQTLDELNREFYFEYYSNNADILLQMSDSGTVTKDSSLNTFLNSKIENSTDSWQPAIILDNYIVNHDFNVGGVYYNSSYSGGDKGLIKEKYENSRLTWKGKIGLMDITEYVEASTNPNCTSVYSNYYYAKDSGSNYINDQENFVWPCSTNDNWLKKGTNEWSLSPRSNSLNYVWYVNSAGYFFYTSTYNSNGGSSRLLS